MSICKGKLFPLALMLTISLLFGCQPASNTPIQRWQHAVEGAYAANISNDARYSVVSSIHHGLSLWDLKNNALKYTWSQQQNSSDNLVLAVDIADNNSHALTASSKNFQRVGTQRCVVLTCSRCS